MNIKFNKEDYILPVEKVWLLRKKWELLIIAVLLVLSLLRENESPYYFYLALLSILTQRGAQIIFDRFSYLAAQGKLQEAGKSIFDKFFGVEKIEILYLEGFFKFYLFTLLLLIPSSLAFGSFLRELISSFGNSHFYILWAMFLVLGSVVITQNNREELSKIYKKTATY